MLTTAFHTYAPVLVLLLCYKVIQVVLQTLLGVHDSFDWQKVMNFICIRLLLEIQGLEENLCSMIISKHAQ